MSTILNALKRLEDESRAEDGKQIPVSMAGRASVSASPWRLRLVLAVAALALCAGAAVFWVYGGRSAPEGADGEALPPAPPAEMAGRETVRKAPPPTPSPREGEAAHNPITAARRDRRPAPASRPTPANTKAIMTAPHYVPPDPEGPPTPARAAAPRPAGPAAKVPPPGPDVLPSAPPDPYALAEVLPKDALQLQAISWSDRPSERITIIAGRLLREGQVIDGYTVIEIRANDVIVEKAGQRWKLIYGSR